MNTLLGGLSIIMIETIISIGLGIAVLGVFLVCTRLVHDSHIEELEAEKYRQAIKYNFP